MATSLKNPPATELTSNNTKKYLDFAGLNALWDNICDKFAPQWKTVNFDFFEHNQPTAHIDKDGNESVVLLFQNLSMPPTADGVVDHTHVQQVPWFIPAAGKDAEGNYAAGVMSGVDKAKLDALDSTLGSNIDTAVKINEIKVGDSKDTATSLVVDITTNTDETKNKVVAFGLDYNADTDELSIVDLNNNKAKVSSVKILEDAFKDAIFQNADVIVKEDGNTYLHFELKITNQKGETTIKELEVNVNDLVSIYEAGDGIDLSIGNGDLTDDNKTSVIISVIAPKVVSNDNKIGGIKSNNIYSESTVTNWKNTETKGAEAAPAIQNLSNASGRYFGVETDKDGHAFVNVPVATLSVGTDPTSDTETISNNDADAKFTVVSGLSTTLSGDGQTWTIVPELKEITLSREEEITVTEKIAETEVEVDANGGVITYIDGINVKENTHELEYTPKKVKLVETSITLTEKNVDNDPDNAPDITVALTPGVTTPVSIPVVTNIEATGTLNHTLVETTQKLNITVADPAAIDIDYIEGLIWQVPITKQYYRNESEYEQAADHDNSGVNAETPKKE